MIWDTLKTMIGHLCFSLGYQIFIFKISTRFFLGCTLANDDYPTIL